VFLYVGSYNPYRLSSYSSWLGSSLLQPHHSPFLAFLHQSSLHFSFFGSKRYTSCYQFFHFIATFWLGFWIYFQLSFWQLYLSFHLCWLSEFWRYRHPYQENRDIQVLFLFYLTFLFFSAIVFSYERKSLVFLTYFD
jgi:hypothetical protein